MLELDHHLARERVRVGRHVGDGVDRAARHAGGLERFDQVFLFQARRIAFRDSVSASRFFMRSALLAKRAS